MTTKILEYFPLDKPRDSQKIVLESLARTFQSEDAILLEAPVGSGKSAIAIALARYFGGAHILTPRKSLQDQYFEDFHEHVVLMKGRAAYPCTIDESQRSYNSIIRMVEVGKVEPPSKGRNSCAEGPCLNSPAIKAACTGARTCPYERAIEVSQQSDIVVHNFHSFVFQTWFGGKFKEAPILIIDEAHDVEKILRDFGTSTVPLPFSEKEWSTLDIPTDFTKTSQWCDWLISDFITKRLSDIKPLKKGDKSPREKYLEKIELVRDLSKNFENRFFISLDLVMGPSGRAKIPTLRLIPDELGGLFKAFLKPFGAKLLMMSGTVYSKEQFCRNIGISPTSINFQRISSTFPVENRRGYLIDDLMVDTSHSVWNSNFPAVLESIKKIMARFPDDKGLIHTPSYLANAQLAAHLKDPRIVTHGPNDFHTQLSRFYLSEKPQVFLSPICQQGVDFKGERARFQIILRVPYPNVGDPFVKFKMEKDRAWYNYQALVVWGQQMGRINRSEEDIGVTLLLDSRFPSFLKRSPSIPKWQQSALVYKENMK